MNITTYSEIKRFNEKNVTDDGTRYFKNYENGCADVISIGFPEDIYYEDYKKSYSPHEYLTDEQLTQMFSVKQEYIFTSELKVNLDAIDINLLINYIEHMKVSDTRINFVGYCHEINERIITILTVIVGTGMKIRLLAVWINEAIKLDQINLLKQVDQVYVTDNDVEKYNQINLLRQVNLGNNKENTLTNDFSEDAYPKREIEIRFKHIHDLSITEMLKNVTLSSVKIRVKIETCSFKESMLLKAFSNLNSTIKFSLIILIDIKEVKKNKNIIKLPMLDDIEYLAFYRKDNKYNSEITIIIPFNLRRLVFFGYTKPILLDYVQITAIKLIQCSGKHFKLTDVKNKNCQRINALIFKNIDNDQIGTLLLNINLSVMEAVIMNIIIAKKGFQEFTEVEREKTITEYYGKKSGEVDVKNTPFNFNTVLNFNLLRNLVIITLQNFPTTQFLHSLITFNTNIRIFGISNTYNYMVYEGTVTPKVLTSYVQFNRNCDFSLQINHHFYDLFRVTIYQDNTSIPDGDNPDATKNTKIIGINENTNDCEEKYVNAVSVAIGIRMTQLFAINKNQENVVIKNK